MTLTMPAKTRRVEARLDPESDDVISRAAAVLGVSKGSFLVRSARAEADRVLARADVTLMPAEQFDAMLAALDEPEVLPVLSRLAASPKPYRRA
jgi:uncharacterized protein (DUF1778 family)